MSARILSELRRRHVFRVAGVYAVVAFCIWQVADLAFPALQLPEWTNTFVVIVAVLGLPLALVLAWAYEVTPAGVQKESELTVAAAPAALPRNRIAVLPFANISPSADDEYFAEGMTEELISTLSRISGLDVIARTSVMPYKGQPKSVTEIGRELSVGCVLEGSVRRAGDRLRITVQLIDASSQGHLWSEDYDRELRDVFQIQTDIAKCVGHCLSARLLRGEEQPSAIVHLAAYDLYLLGRHHWNRRTDEGIRTAISYFGSLKPWLDYYAANVRLLLGERENALAMLGAFLEAIPQRKAYVAADWMFRDLWDDPRFIALVRSSDQ